MKRNGFQWLLLLLVFAPLHAAPSFWANPSFTPTPVPPPQIQDWGQMSEDLQPTATPVLAPKVQIATPTPTPVPGLSPLNPTQAALFSVVLPGSGHVYAGDPLKGILFASLFGVGLWQTLDNLQLVHNSSGDLVAKNETAGNLFGLATLAAYGFGIQDALNTAVNYNKRNNLTLSIGLDPEPNAMLAFKF